MGKAYGPSVGLHIEARQWPVSATSNELSSGIYDTSAALKAAKKMTMFLQTAACTM